MELNPFCIPRVILEFVFSFGTVQARSPTAMFYYTVALTAFTKAET
jgi:hypothetical protein